MRTLFVQCLDQFGKQVTSGDSESVKTLFPLQLLTVNDITQHNVQISTTYWGSKCLNWELSSVDISDASDSVKYGKLLCNISQYSSNWLERFQHHLSPHVRKHDSSQSISHNAWESQCRVFKRGSSVDEWWGHPLLTYDIQGLSPRACRQQNSELG